MLLIKVLHMSFAMLAIALFATRAVLGFQSGDGQIASPRLARVFKIAPHVVYTVLLLCGLYLLWQLPLTVAQYPHWLLVKIGLFVVAVSASAKAFRAGTNYSQFKQGVFVTALAYVAILWLVIAKPTGF